VFFSFPNHYMLYFQSDLLLYPGMCEAISTGVWSNVERQHFAAGRVSILIGSADAAKSFISLLLLTGAPPKLEPPFARLETCKQHAECE
jgi:hypothetical protein